MSVQRGMNVSPNLIDLAWQVIELQSLIIYWKELGVFVFCWLWGFFCMCIYYTLFDSTWIGNLGWEMNQLDIWVDACWRNQFRWSTKPNLYQFLIDIWLFCKNHENPVTANIGIHHSGKDEGPFMKIIVHTCRLYNPMYCRQNEGKVFMDKS